MKISINQRIIIGFFVLIAIYGISGFISVRNLKESREITTRNSLVIQPSIILLNELELIIVTTKNYASTWLTFDITDHSDKLKLLKIHNEEYPLLKERLLEISGNWKNIQNNNLLDSTFLTYETVINNQKKIMTSLNRIEAYQDYLLRVKAESDYLEKSNKGTEKTIGILNDLINSLKIQSVKEEDMMLESFASIKTATISLTILSVFIGLIVAFATLRSVKLEEQKREITEERDLIQCQKEIIEIKNREITDSINYAKRIQQSILPSTESIKRQLHNHFVFYKPRDIVSGDFYWFRELDKESVLIAAADCTGHGVPGAFVSFVCNSSLNSVVTEFGISVPGEILDKTSTLVQSTFAQYGEDNVQDGMDIALCCLKRGAEGIQLQFAGANNSAYIISNGKTRMLTANRQPVGASHKTEKFITHSNELQADDTVYIFTDGFVDQFGGPQNKKYKSKKFIELLERISTENIEKQELLLEAELKSWMGTNSQVDDILIIGIKV